MLYKKCKVYERSDSEQTAVAYIDIETASGMSNGVAWSGTELVEGTQMTVTTTTGACCNFASGTKNVIIPNFADLKIVGSIKRQVNKGMLRPKFKYTLTLEG